MRPHASAFAKRFCLAATFFALSGIALAASGCSAKAEPQTWVLWYVPNEPKPGMRLPQPCKTYVFATSPLPDEYAVATVRGWTGARLPTGNTAVTHPGEVFTGPLNVGPATIHDESNGYNLTVNVVYKIGTYLPAKGRADADCPSVAAR